MKKSAIKLADKTRKDFPIFNDAKNKLIYFDHAATSQKPQQVLDRLNTYYSQQNANVHRGAHKLSAIATESFENARQITANFINATSSKEIVFTRNATEAINLVSNTWGKTNLKDGDEILISIMEHHSNIVPWQLLAKHKGCKLIYAGITSDGELDIEDIKKKITSKTKLISLVHISNTLGCCNPIKDIAKIGHDNNSLILVDACQSLAHQKIDVQDLNIDFLVGSSHKICGPTGIGFLWGQKTHLEEMPPFLGGGEMINEVFLHESNWADLPHKFEAGTPAIGEAIAMGEAINYLQSVGLENIQSWEHKLTKYLFSELNKIKEVNILGPTPQVQPHRGALVTFSVKGLHANDIATLLDVNSICIRSGHHCCQPLHSHFGINATARASLSFTTTMNEIDIFIEKLESTIYMLKENS